MNRDLFEALATGQTEPEDELDLVMGFARLGRARAPGRALADSLSLPELPLEESPPVLLAAQDDPGEFPARYGDETLEITLDVGLGGLPAARLSRGDQPVTLMIEGEEVPLSPGDEALLPWLDRSPISLELRILDVIRTLNRR